MALQGERAAKGNHLGDPDMGEFVLGKGKSRSRQ